jgi:hypothetical protein
VKRGDPLMMIGQPQELRAELRVAEKDIRTCKVDAKGQPRRHQPAAGQVPLHRRAHRAEHE